jgi:hypothetical protein
LATNKVRALCAQIALEIDPKKSALLIEELTEVLLQDYLEVFGKKPSLKNTKPPENSSP